MLVSSQVLLAAINKLIAAENSKSDNKGLSRLHAWFTNLVNVQTPPSVPAIRLIEEEKTVVLYCNEDLWNMVDKWKSKDLKSMGFLDGMAIWKEIKKIMEKGESV